MKCNIGRSGRTFRLLAGLILVATAVVLHMVEAPPGGWMSMILEVGLFAGGLFMVVEGAIGWCALRALGYKTRF